MTIRQDCYEIHLTKGHVALVDWKDADLCRFKWIVQENVRRGRVLRYAMRFTRAAEGRKRKVYLHTEVAKRAGIYVEGCVTDHRDEDGLNNRRGNLRPLPNPLNITKRSGKRGVYWHKAAQKWAASIRKGGRNHHLGLFATEAEAQAARIAAEEELGL